MKKSSLLNSLRKLILLVVMAVLLSGCSAAKLSYNFADWWLGRKVGEYVSLNAEQKTFFTSEVDKLHAWHRSSQLVNYAEFVKTARLRLLSPELNVDIVQNTTNQLADLFRPLVKQFIPPLAKLLAGITPQQVDQLLDNLAEKNKEYVRKYVPPELEKQIEKRTKRMRSTAKKWLGKLSKPQQRLIFTWAEGVQSPVTYKVGVAALWQSDLKKILALRESSVAIKTEQIELFLQSYFFENDKYDSAAFHQLLKDNHHLTCRLVVDLMAMASVKQRTHLDKKLSRLVDDFNELSKR